MMSSRHWYRRITAWVMTSMILTMLGFMAVTQTSLTEINELIHVLFD